MKIVVEKMDGANIVEIPLDTTNLLGVRFEIDGAVYGVSIEKDGALRVTLTRRGNNQLVILPRAANAVHIKPEQEGE